MIKKLSFLIIPLLYIFCISSSVNVSVKEQQVNKVEEYYQTVKQNEEIKSKLVEHVAKHIPKNSKVDPELVVDLCIKYEFDIPLLMSQAKVESNWGTLGRAVKTNSVFGVGAYDDGTSKYYDDVNDSIEPYIKLVKYNYLVNKSVDKLLTNYVNVKGKRYATNTEYEVAVKRNRNKIINNSEIYNLQRELYTNI